ncbi:flagellar hook-associated protein FlgK [Silanimonas sp.]|uniref:flagellar hook-associated protein FlgK n=1 Tax=Silanimonas sp. TaxID=1929290 RepID=UPI0022C456B4|nr:flagellar hook-associated protein FlgK [Silanimonas sp.]MCZ8062139.1 flagellar hook-associated protein FlgK [Silanimonas sp.]
MPSILGNGTSALLAFQRALATSSHNIANATVDGYTRQRVELSNRPGDGLRNNYIGAGVQIASITRLSDTLVTNRLLDSQGEIGRLDLVNGFALRIDQLFTDATTGLAQPFSAFFDAAQGVAAEPASQAARTELLGRAEALVARFDQLQGGLDQIDREINARLTGGAEEVNRLASEIARLNVEIGRNGPGNASPDLLDQRDRLVADVANLTGVTTLPQEDGSLNVFTTGGQPIVVGATASRFVTVQDDFRNDRVVLALETTTGTVRLGAGSIAGQLGGALSSRADLVDAGRAELGRIAATLAEIVNGQSTAGLDLNGNVGTDFFALAAPQPLANRNNTGTATLAVDIANVGALDGVPLEFRFDGANWTARRGDNGAPVALAGLGTVASPFVVNGIEVVVSGAAAANDRFLIEPTSNAARDIALAINDPNRIAAASRIRPSADLTNLGQGRVVSLAVLDPTNAALTTPATVQFLTPTTFSLNGGPAQAYTPGANIDANGWRLVLDGVPRAGDTFRVGANVSNSSDNTNMRAWAQLDDSRVLGGGANSLNDAIVAQTTRIGSAARETSFSLDSQKAIDEALVQQRESLSGVNLDEEAADLLRFQQAYQAAAQVISIADTVFQTFLAAVRR